MDLSGFEHKDILLSAMRSEEESRELYLALKDKVKNAFLRDRLTFLAKEEEKHRLFIETLYRRDVPEGDIVLPERSVVPLPRVDVDDSMPLSEVMDAAMQGEKAAAEFYSAVAALYPDDMEARGTLEYFAKMEMGHFQMLQTEKENLLAMEDFDSSWPMMHVGP